MDGGRERASDPDATARELVDVCRERIDDALCGVGHYTADEWGFAYLREDVREECARIQLDLLAWRARQVHDALSTALDDGSPLGSPRRTVHTFDGRQVVQYLLEDASGVFVVVDPSDGSVPADSLPRSLPAVDPCPVRTEE